MRDKDESSSQTTGKREETSEQGDPSRTGRADTEDIPTKIDLDVGVDEENEVLAGDDHGNPDGYRRISA